MLGELGVELVIILVLTLANGFFSGSEIAIVSARRSRLEAQAGEGSKAAQQAIHLADNPDRFLATVQIGISLIGTFSAAFGGARIGDILTIWLESIPVLQPYAATLSLIIVVAFITYISLIFGELVPKRLALQSAERLAIVAAPVMTVLAAAARPLVGFLTLSVNLVLRILGQHDPEESQVTEEDIVYMLREGQAGGAVEAGEIRLIQRVFQFTDRSVRSVMTPRTEMVAVPVTATLEQIAVVFLNSGYSRLPVYEGSSDHVIGVINAKDMMRYTADPKQLFNLRDAVRIATFVLDSNRIDEVMTSFRRKGIHIAFVIDEYGQTAGLVTMEDLLEELVGEIHDEYDQGEENPFVQREDGSWLVDGMAAYDKVQDRVGLPESVGDGDYTTLAGLILTKLGHIPVVGDTVKVGDYVIEIVDMDGYRVDKVLIQRARTNDIPSE